MKYRTYGCKAQSEKLPWSFSPVVESVTRFDAAVARNRLLTSESSERPWTLAITLTPDNRPVLQTIPCALAR